jgi:hypothetical protein
MPETGRRCPAARLATNLRASGNLPIRFKFIIREEFSPKFRSY